ncbi:MAG: nitroreductase family protein [Tissierellia bacterium]|nr:nitroreductase family protein [Tissierellia bacterium]
MEFKNLTKERYSCRSLSERKVEREKIEEIIEIARLAPTAVNRQPIKIFAMDSEDAKENIRKSTRCIYGADTFLVVGYKEDEAWVREFDNRNFGDIDAGIVATHILLAISSLGLNTTWVGHFDAPLLKEKYPEMKDYELIALFPIGYAAEDGGPSDRHFQRKSKDEIISYL